MVQLSRKAGVRLLFDLDLELRVGAHWDLQNAMNLMDYSVSQGYGDNIDWELGNGMYIVIPICHRIISR